MKKRLEATRMLRIGWTDQKSDEEVITKIRNTRKLILKIRQRQLKMICLYNEEIGSGKYNTHMALECKKT